jgi:ribosomal protein L11 methyltransferase
VLSLDPGMAFGTGSHHTTRMCLELLEKEIHPVDDMLDIGCGSGILSIAGVLLGARDAYAVDVDPIAESIAYENAAMNGIAKEDYHVLIGDVLNDAALLDTLKARKYRIITANIIASVVIALCNIVPELLSDDGVFISSGLIAERLDEVLEALDANGFEVLEIRASEDWRAVLARRK